MADQSDKPKAPARPVSSQALAWEPWSHGERFGGRVKPIGDRAGAVRLGVHIEELPPGKQSCPLHFHYLEEEHLFALEGEATLLLGDERIPMRAGDHACFPAGQEAGHCLVNEGDAPFRFLMIGERNPADVVVYPASAKILVCAADKVLDRGAVRDYWDGEE